MEEYFSSSLNLLGKAFFSCPVKSGNKVKGKRTESGESSKFVQ